jgi:hypothetical protein
MIMAVPEVIFKGLMGYDARRAHRLPAERREEVFMDARICKSASAFVLLASLGVAGCDNDNGSTGHLTGPATVTSALVTVEPAAVLPVFVASPFCFTATPFLAGFTLLFRADQELIINGFDFEFLDRFGGRSVPTSIPTSSPIPTPGTSPIPIPAISRFDGLRMSPGSSRALPFLLQFGCGVPASGTLFVNVNTTRGGSVGVTRLSVRIVG